jgi:PAS domain S-box-containing protein
VRIWVSDGHIALPGEVTPTADPRAAHLAILHAPASPGPSGPERVAALRSGLSPGTQLLVLGADDEPATLEALLLAGADDVLVWPRDQALLPARLRVLGARRLAGAEARLRAVIELAGDAIFVKDVEGRYTLLNPQAARRFDRSAGDCVGKTDEELLGAERARATVEADRRVLATRRPVVVEQRARVGGQECVLSTSTVPFVDDAGALLGVLGSSHDVTEQKRMETQLHLADRMVSVGTLAAGVAHEINNPLAYVTGNLDYVRGRIGDVISGRSDPAELPDLVVALDDAIEGTERMRAIVRDLRTFSRPDENDLSPIDVARVIDVAVRMTQPAIRHRARVHKDSAPVPPVLGSAARLGQVLVNLLVNSVQAMPADRGAEANEISVTAGSHGGDVVIELRDNGVGIPEDVRRHIFDPFFTTKPVGEGTGLGLWICRNAIAGMGGEISVESEPGRGTLFRLRLPAASVPVPPVRREAAAATGRGRARLRLLVLDDEAKMVAGLRRMLGDDNDVVPFTDAREALAHIKTGEEFDVVLCDLMMPGMDGMTFYDELVRVAPAIAQRTGFVTGGALTDPARAFVDGQPGRWLQKPFEIDSLRAFVQTLLSA